MFAEINECELYYEVHGEEDGQPIFFIHGGPGLGDCRADADTFTQLGDQYKLIFLDMRGSGRSEEKDPYTHKQWTEDIDKLREHLGLNQIIIHGSSYGGFIALEYVLRYPQNVSHVLLNVTAASNEHHYLAIENALNSHLPGINHGMLKRLFNGEVASNEEFKEMYSALLPLYSIHFDPVVAQKKVDSIFFHYATHNAAFHENLAQFDVRDRLKEIKTPVLVTGGKLDWITPAIYSEEIAKDISGAKLFIFEENGHAVIREKSEQYISILRNFLNEQNVKGEIKNVHNN
ncbi:alpha/beta fold hydrolase [Bacillus mycoides]|uniref:alpha/beta fold hydrolase n=1 Tax=Bacillus mycoides TaxID=1405 RepID=UPI00211228C2|nr:alpha/beta hydrolase [Bacillus mycoides]MCQ6530423.1 alpha/beta hydrolase [Bacillus mycoides]